MEDRNRIFAQIFANHLIFLGISEIRFDPVIIRSGFSLSSITWWENSMPEKAKVKICPQHPEGKRYLAFLDKDKVPVNIGALFLDDWTKIMWFSDPILMKLYEKKAKNL